MLQVSSEVGRLRRVLVHEPGLEVDRMVPSMMEELLFDDILFGERAREEHRRFRRLLQLLGVDVVEARDLLAEALRQEGATTWLWGALRSEIPAPLRDRLRRLDPEVLTDVLVAGLLPDAEDRVAGESPRRELFELPPLPNWCFQRDPQVVIGGGVVFAAMATPARWREALLARVVFRFHPDLKGSPVLADPLLPESERDLFLGLHRPRLEGGDVLVLAPDVVAVGLSERTNAVGVEALVRGLARSPEHPRWLLVVHLPRRRAYMHLDTVFTPADRDAALIYPPVVSGDGPEAAEVYEVDLDAADPTPRHRGRLLAALAARGLDYEPLSCGGDDALAQQREQWTDGANAFCLAPGVVTLYDRNVATAEELDRRGFRVVAGDDVLLGRQEVDLDGGRRCCLLLASNEISRARGGPHCLSHPLERDGA